MKITQLCLAVLACVSLACASKPTPVTVTGAAEDRASLAGKWIGEYNSPVTGRSGSTDTPQAFVYPGFSLHDELELLVRSGLTPLEALRAATYNPAEFLGALDSLGTVTQGKVADLVLLDADPLADVRNTRRISAVIANGRLFDRAARAQLLKRVETALKH